MWWNYIGLVWEELKWVPTLFSGPIAFRFLCSSWKQINPALPISQHCWETIWECKLLPFKILLVFGTTFESLYPFLFLHSTAFHRGIELLIYRKYEIIPYKGIATPMYSSDKLFWLATVLGWSMRVIKPTLQIWSPHWPTKFELRTNEESLAYINNFASKGNKVSLINIQSLYPVYFGLGVSFSNLKHSLSIAGFRPRISQWPHQTEMDWYSFLIYKRRQEK